MNTRQPAFNLTAVASAMLLSSSLVSSPVAANTIQKLQQDQQENSQQTQDNLDKPTDIQDLQIDQNIQRQGQSQLAKTVKFQLNSISVKGNTLLKNQQIIPIAKPYIGKMVTSADLQTIAQQITQIFHQLGYTTSRCVVPAQQINNGVVVLQIEENRLNQIQIIGENSFEYDKKLFLRHLNDLTGKVIHAPTLKKRLSRLTFLPSARITPELNSVGFGKTDLVLKIDDIKATKALSLYTNASRLTGDKRLSLSGLFVNPTGSGDYLQLGATIDPAETANFSSLTAKYVMPYGQEGGRLSAQLADIRYRVSDDVVNSSVFEIGGQSRLFKLSVENPLALGQNSQYSVGVEHKTTANEQIQHVNFSEFVPMVSLDECPTGQIVTQDSVDYCQFDDADLLAGFKWLDTEETLVMLSASLSSSFRYQLLGNAAFTKVDVKVAKALEGAFGGLTQAQVEDKFKNKNAQTNGDEIRTLTGPVGNDSLMQADFWKAYLDLTHYSRINAKQNIILGGHFEFTPEKAIPGSYKYGGADSGVWGGDIDIAWQYVWTDRLQTKLGWHSEFAMNYVSEQDYPDADGDGKVKHLTCGIKEVEVNAYFSCWVHYPYLQASYDYNQHSFSAMVRTQPKKFESREKALTLGYVYRF
ncbi:hemolysin activation/secretion protein [Catenovulum agarivorans DS-2]|uniref:Hemolysin activation/secretion protein n=1 Tax=Catenovulum agarivorans DS-2 TaxID=1328313 RepID=W7QRN0_9ALTE|nr:POTRA domain-containing protein [Catenovulum agarivorans]EWH11652.1 hemolysin activation/secretion protein [Catenovulum agarivorans DS-2]